MKIAFVADLHLGNHRKLGGPLRCSLNERCWNALEVFQCAVARAREKQCHALFVLGDFFDTARPLPQLYHEAMSIAEDAGIAIYFMLGNHETVSAAQADNSLAPLLHLDPGGLARDSVIEQPRAVKVGRNVVVICAPYIEDLEQDLALADWSALFQQTEKTKHVILALHAGLTDASTEKFLRGKPGTIGIGAITQLCADEEISCVVAGHFHQHRLWRQEQDHGMVEIMQLGALCPRDYRDPGLDGYGTLAIWDNGKLSREEIPGPRFFDFSPNIAARQSMDPKVWQELLAAAASTGRLLYPRVSAPADRMPSYQKALLELKAGGHIADYDLSPNASAIAPVAAWAAEAGRSASSLDRALETCTEGLRRSPAVKVQQLARKYLSKSKETHAGSLSIDIRQIKLVHLLRHSDTTLNLPAEGVVVVQGPNDSGKSSLAEAVAAAGWGKTMRKFPPWQAGRTSAAEIELAEGFWVARCWKDGKPKLDHLDFGLGDESNAETNKPATNTVAQAQLDSHIGSFELWQRSHVLSSIDALRFSVATDGERKRIAEQVVGLDFDTALKACRADIRKVREELGDEKHKRDTAKLKRDGEERRGEAAQATIARLRRRDGKPALNQRQLRQQQEARDKALKENASQQRQLERDRNARRSEIRRLDGEIGKAAAGQELHKKQAEKLRGDSCPTCGQRITKKLRQDLEARAEDRRCIARDRRNALIAEREAFETECRRIGDQILELDAAAREIRSALQAESSASEVADGEINRQLEIVDAAAKLVRSYARELDNHDDEIFLLERHLQVLLETEKVLGLKGARALVLSDVFLNISEAAKHALSQMSADITIAVGASKVVVNGKDYRASGHGVRKKVDFALAVALAEVTAAASGRKPGTLWLDEIDDGLDSGEGITQVAQLIQELARDRCVVVITHSDRLAEELEAVERWDVCDGKVEVRNG